MIKVGLLGTGFGKTHAELYKKINGFELVCVYGRNIDKLESIEKDLNVKTTNKIDDILNNPDIELIDICLPTELHYKYTIEAIANGKNVFCETPVASNLIEAEKMKLCANQNNKNIFVDLFYKFSAPHNIAIQKINNNELGKVLTINSYNKTSQIWGDLGLDKNIASFHIHNFDFILDIIEAPEYILSSGIDLDEKSVVETILRNNNQIATIQSCSNLPKNYPFCIGFEIVCENGTIRFEAEYGTETREIFKIYFPNGENNEIDIPKTDDYEEVLLHVKNCLENKCKSNCIDITHAIESQKIKDKIIDSIKNEKIYKSSTNFV